MQLARFLIEAVVSGSEITSRVPLTPVRQPNSARSTGWQRKIAGLRGEEFEFQPSFPLALAGR